MSQIKITHERLADIEAKAAVFKQAHRTWRFDPLRGVIETFEDRFPVCDTLGEDRVGKFVTAANPAVMLAMVEWIRQLEAAQRWVKITDDPATWPPVGSIVWAVNDCREVAVLMFDGFENNRMLWYKAKKMKLGHYPDEDKIVFKYSITSDHGPITHWRPI